MSSTTTTTPSTTSTSTIPPPAVPDVCFSDLGFDAVGLLRGEIFIFKGEYVWRLDERYRIQSGYPIRFREIFVDLSPEVKKIDAIYERLDSAIVIFSGDQYWVFNGDYFIENSPRPISDYGFDNVTKIDAAMVWSKNGRTYLFSGSKFIRYNDETKQIDPNYPALITEKWHGIPNNIDAVTSVANGKLFVALQTHVSYAHHNYFQEKLISSKEICTGCMTIIEFAQDEDILEELQQCGWDVHFTYTLKFDTVFLLIIYFI